MVAFNVHVPTIAGYFGAVAILIIGVSVGFSAKDADSDADTAHKQLISTTFILISIIVAVLTYFISREGGLSNIWFAKTSPSKELELVPAI